MFVAGHEEGPCVDKIQSDDMDVPHRLTKINKTGDCVDIIANCDDNSSNETGNNFTLGDNEAKNCNDDMAAKW